MSGFFKSMKKELDSAAKSVGREVDYLSKSASNTVQEHRSSPILDQFRSGNVVQLMSRSSGKALQIVTSPTGQLVVDGCGPEGPQVYHAHWTIVDEGKNIIKLHNNNNFLAIVNGCTCVINFTANPQTAGVETKFRVSQSGNFILLESFKENGRYIGVLPTGELKSALATGKDNDANFAVRLIYCPGPAQYAQTTCTVVHQPPYHK